MLKISTSSQFPFTHSLFYLFIYSSNICWTPTATGFSEKAESLSSKNSQSCETMVFSRPCDLTWRLGGRWEDGRQSSALPACLSTGWAQEALGGTYCFITVVLWKGQAGFKWRQQNSVRPWGVAGTSLLGAMVGSEPRAHNLAWDPLSLFKTKVTFKYWDEFYYEIGS